jgi:hypothetical protein
MNAAISSLLAIMRSCNVRTTRLGEPGEVVNPTIFGE